MAREVDLIGRKRNNGLEWQNVQMRASKNEPDANYSITFDLVCDDSGKIVDWLFMAIHKDEINDVSLVIDGFLRRKLSDVLKGAPIFQTLIDLSRQTMATGRTNRFELYIPWSRKHFLGTMLRINSITLAISLLDVTQKKRIEEEQRSNHEILMNIVDSSPTGICVRDLSGKILVFNESMAKHNKISQGKVIGKNIYEIWPKEVADAFMAKEEKVIEEGRPFRFEEALLIEGVLRTFTTLKFPIRDEHGRIYSIGSVVTDITEQKRIEETLLDNEAWTKAFLENSALIAWMKNEEGQYVYLSKNFENHFNVSLDERGSITEFDLWPEALAESYRKNDRLVLESGNSIEVVEESCNADGDQRWWLSFKFPFNDSSGKRFVGGLGVDITKRMVAEKALQEADRHKDEFLAMLSHELRNPMASIQNGLYILDHVTPGGEQANRAKEIIDRQFGQLCHLVDDLLDVTRINRNKLQLKKERLELITLVQKTIEDYQLVFEQKDIRLNLQAAAGEIYVFGDPTRLAQVIGNLLQNAVKFSDDGGKVQVKVGVDDAHKNVIISFADTGIGIEPELIPHMFEPFIQADKSLDRSNGGLGLGLTLVKGLIELHGGQVDVASPGVGQGTTFELRLPLDFISQSEERQKELYAADRRDCRVLIIEDNMDVAESLRDVVRILGYEVAAAFNGPHGLEMARKCRPDIVLCDIGLPGMDGYAVAKAIRADKFLKEVYLLALTGYALPEDIVKAVEAGFDQHLAKPPEFKSLQQILAQVSKRLKKPI